MSLLSSATAYADYSVLMSVYYKEKAEHLREAMNSIWNQTSPTNDFVLVCDGPLNAELDSVINEIIVTHPELTVKRLQKNVGLGDALNFGLEYCKNELVARMDSDDVSHPTRCKTQLEVFRENPDIAICSGTVSEFVDDEHRIVGKRELPFTSNDIKRFSKKRNPFNHPAVMFKKTAVIKAGGYDETYHLFEDYYLWIRMLMLGYQGYNIPDSILDMRVTSDLYSRRGGKDYARYMLAFHKWMKDTGWSSTADYCFGALPHALVCLLPNGIRKQLYKWLHS